MIFNIDKDLWFDNEKINIIVGEENLKKYKQNYDKYEQIKINKEDNSDLRTVYIQIFTLFKFDKNLKKYNRKTTLFIVK